MGWPSGDRAARSYPRAESRPGPPKPADATAAPYRLPSPSLRPMPHPVAMPAPAPPMPAPPSGCDSQPELRSQVMAATSYRAGLLCADLGPSPNDPPHLGILGYPRVEFRTARACLDPLSTNAYLPAFFICWTRASAPLLDRPLARRLEKPRPNMARIRHHRWPRQGGRPARRAQLPPRYTQWWHSTRGKRSLAFVGVHEGYTLQAREV